MVPFLKNLDFRLVKLILRFLNVRALSPPQNRYKNHGRQMITSWFKKVRRKFPQSHFVQPYTVTQLNHTMSWRQFQSTRSKSRNNRLWEERLDILVLSPARNNEYDSFERLLKIELVNVYFVRKNLSKSVTMVGRNREKSLPYDINMVNVITVATVMT